MLYFKRITMVFLLIPVLAFSGCRSIVRINNRTDPKNFDQIVLITGSDTYYDEISVNVPDELRKEDYEITRVEIFGDVSAQSLGATLVVDLYIGLEPGSANLDDSSVNEVIASAVLTPEDRDVEIRSVNSDLIYKALDHETFWMKATIDYQVSSLTIIDIKNLYMDIQLERETGGLFPILYLF
ncbi:MAG: hypothetical protein R6U43_10420 [Candidatus Krumholzibacteriales bacterium]